MKNTIAYLFLCLLIFLFAYTGISKWLDADGFYRDLRNQVFPRSWVPVLLYGLPLLEVVIAVSICFERTRMVGLICAFGLLLLFTAYTGLVLLGIFNRVPCSCGGVIRMLSWKQHLLFNIVCLAVNAMAIKLFMHENRVSRKPVNRVGDISS